MFVERNWITSNIHERKTNPVVDFKCQLHMFPFEKLNFSDATDYTVKSIAEKYDNLYLGLSGGYDSEYVLRAFIRNGVKINPVIVKLIDNSLETSYAFNACRKLGIDPIVISVTEKEMLLNYKEIYDVFNFSGPGCIGMIYAAKYVKENNGVFIHADMFEGLSGGNIKAKNDNFCTNIWDYFLYGLYPKVAMSIPFFLYNPSIIYSILKFIQDYPEDITWQEMKYELYNIDFRPKLQTIFSPTVNDIMKKIMVNKKIANNVHYFGKLKHLIDRFN